MLAVGSQRRRDVVSQIRFEGRLTMASLQVSDLDMTGSGLALKSQDEVC